MKRITKKQKIARQRAEEYARQCETAEQETLKQIDNDEAPFILSQIEQLIQDEHGMQPPYDRDTLKDTLPAYMFSKWDKYNDIVNPEVENKVDTSVFGIDFGKSVECESENQFSLDDMYKDEFEKEPEIPADAPSSVRQRDLPNGWLNVYDENDDFSFDEIDDESDDIADSGYDYGN